MHCVEHNAFIFALCQDHKLRMWSYKVNATLIVAVSYNRIANCREVEISLVSSRKNYQISYFGDDGPFPDSDSFL